MHFDVASWWEDWTRQKWAAAVEMFFEMEVSYNRGTPKNIHFNKMFHYKPAILGYLPLWKSLNSTLIW